MNFCSVRQVRVFIRMHFKLGAAVSKAAGGKNSAATEKRIFVET